MIFLTVGTQLKFDRLVRAVDAWAGGHPETEVFAQIGPSDYVPQHMPWAKTIDPQEFAKRFAAAEVLVGHAGMGTILSCLENEKRLVVMPRMARYQEHRNDHQLATAKCFAHLKHVKIAYGDAELHDCLDHLVDLKPGGRIDKVASPELLTSLRYFVDTGLCPEPVLPSDEDLLAAPAGEGVPAEMPFVRSPAADESPAVAGVVLLGGSVAVTPWAHRVRRSLLDLPVREGQTLLARWTELLERLRQGMGQDGMAAYLMVGPGSPRPFVGRETGAVSVSVQEDRGAFRGTGGTLRDVAAAFGDDECLLVVNGLQWLPDVSVAWMADLAGMIRAKKADFLLLTDDGGAPLDVMAVRAGCLRAIPSQGFVDLKEQGLQAVAEAHRVSAVSAGDWRGWSVRTEAGYLSAVRAARAGEFGLVEVGASVGKGTHLHDAVVLSDGLVGDRAVVVDAVVCAGELVRDGGLLRGANPNG